MKRHSDNPCKGGRENVKAAQRQDPVSCQFCRAKKLKCDLAQPCSNCRSRGISCVRMMDGGKPKLRVLGVTRDDPDSYQVLICRRFNADVSLNHCGMNWCGRSMWSRWRMIVVTDEIKLCSASKRIGLLAIKYWSRGLVRGHVLPRHILFPISSFPSSTTDSCVKGD